MFKLVLLLVALLVSGLGPGPRGFPYIQAAPDSPTTSTTAKFVLGYNYGWPHGTRITAALDGEVVATEEPRGGRGVPFTFEGLTPGDHVAEFTMEVDGQFWATLTYPWTVTP